MKTIVVMVLALVVLVGCDKTGSSSGAETTSAGSSKSEVEKQLGGLKTGRVVDTGAASGACDAACQSRIKQ